MEIRTHKMLCVPALVLGLVQGLIPKRQMELLTSKENRKKGQ